MSSSREIRAKINSIKNTQKITRAMELVAASKMKKARDKMNAARPYACYSRDIIKHLITAYTEYKHNYFNEIKDCNVIGMIIISTERGLCGGLNINLFKKVLDSIEHYRKQKKSIFLCLIGTKAEHFFKRLKFVKIISLANFDTRNISISSILGSISVMTDAFDKKEISKLIIWSNKFINTIKQEPIKYQLLPIDYSLLSSSIEKNNGSRNWDYIYEPNSKEVLDKLVLRYIESQVYCALVENLSWEQSARMLAMKNATDNAEQIINKLKIKYNKARQSSITQELAEIVSGASAV